MKYKNIKEDLQRAHFQMRSPKAHKRILKKALLNSRKPSFLPFYSFDMKKTSLAVASIATLTLVVTNVFGLPTLLSGNSNGTLNFIDQAYASYEQQDERSQRENLIKHTKVISTMGKDQDAYNDFYQENLLENDEAEEMGVTNGSKVTSNYMFYHENWQDKQGNFLQVGGEGELPLDDFSFLHNHIQLKPTWGLLQKFNPESNKMEFYNARQQGEFQAMCVDENGPQGMFFSTYYPQDSNQAPIVNLNAYETDYRPSEGVRLSDDEDVNATEMLQQFAENPADGKTVLAQLKELQDKSSKDGLGLKYLGEEEHEGKKYAVYSFTSKPQSYSEGLKKKITESWKKYYYFDAETYQLVKTRFITVVDGHEFEVHVNEYETAYLEPNSQIFEPSEYPFLQKVEKEQGCYKNTDAQVMTKMSEAEEQEFFKNLNPSLKEKADQEKASLTEAVEMKFRMMEEYKKKQDSQKDQNNHPKG